MTEAVVAWRDGPESAVSVGKHSHKGIEQKQVCLGASNVERSIRSGCEGK